MNTATTSFSMNTSTSFRTAAKIEQTLGWDTMPTFAVMGEEEALGWDAMPAFGTHAAADSDAELVAKFVRETRSTAATKNHGLASFWSMIGM